MTVEIPVFCLEATYKGERIYSHCLEAKTQTSLMRQAGARVGELMINLRPEALEHLKIEIRPIGGCE